ncbi:uncharacterized protein LOC103751466 isoform X2 [Nannospalax galili]|uniref:uncharacterized protein LOC103751466 isoform X2 n=1 Tax=Nannospalax galili TaxID=1026970 RepID=UPI00111C71FD|nr:uncharacterized protein LOC103751466 isoform X2 [Nannospalax galili]
MPPPPPPARWEEEGECSSSSSRRQPRRGGGGRASTRLAERARAPERRGRHSSCGPRPGSGRCGGVCGVWRTEARPALHRLVAASPRYSAGGLARPSGRSGLRMAPPVGARAPGELLQRLLFEEAAPHLAPGFAWLLSAGRSEVGGFLGTESFLLQTN